MVADEAWAWLRREGYLEPVGLPGQGWHRVCKSPPKRELSLFVRAIKTLGAWSVGDGARVHLSTGSAPDEVLFKMNTPSTDRRPSS